jgi:hypothetical protein
MRGQRPGCRQHRRSPSKASKHPVEWWSDVVGSSWPRLSPWPWRLTLTGTRHTGN